MHNFIFTNINKCVKNAKPYFKVAIKLLIQNITLNVFVYFLDKKYKLMCFGTVFL